jgi:hypothetical protein
VTATAVRLGNLALITVLGLKIFADTFMRPVSRFAHDHLLLQK